MMKRFRLSPWQLFLACIFAGAVFCWQITVAEAYDTLSSSFSQNRLFRFSIFNKGERYGNGPDDVSSWTLGKNERDGILLGSQYWENILGPNAHGKNRITINVGAGGEEGNAAAISPIIQQGPYAGMTQLATSIIHGASFDTAAEIEIGYSPGGRFFGPIEVLTHNGMREDFASTITHELGHALGMGSGAFGKNSFGSTLATWDTFLVDSFGTPASPGMPISEWSGASPGDFILRDNGGYAFFQGHVVMGVLGNAMLDPHGAVSGLPINGFEDNAAELSHIELKNSLMSHQNYRNYGIFMEAELAVLKDLGYNIDLKSQFGLSVYESGNAGIVNTTGFYARNAEGTGWLPGVYNTSTGAVGLHVYGAYNTIIQAADILSAGPGSAGIRIDGHGYDSSSNEIFGNNHVTVAPGFKVHAHGQGGTGVMVTYGNGHTLVNRGEIAALGDGGIGVRFDFGDNELGNSEEYRGSYIWVDEDGNDNTNLSDEGLDGALVDRFDVTGTIAGRKAAIYISENALVEQINIMRGAQLYGDIISRWDPNDPRVQDWQIPGGNANSTLLTFGYEPDIDGEVTGTPDAAFSLQYMGNILGRQGMSVQLAGGDLSWQGRMDVISYQQDNATTLRGIVGDRPSVISADDITIDFGARLGVTDVPFQYGNVVDTGVMPVLHFDAPAYSQDGTLIEGTGGAFAMGAYDYTYANSRWLDGRTIGVDITGRNFNRERGASSAVTAPVALLAHNPSNASIMRRGIEVFSKGRDRAEAASMLLAWSGNRGMLFNDNLAFHRTSRLEETYRSKGARSHNNDAPEQWIALASGGAERSSGVSSLWVTPGYSYTSQSGHAGYDIKGAGVRMGYDTWVNDFVFLGLALSMDFPEYESDHADIDARSVTGSFYGGAFLPYELELGAFAAYGRTRHEQKRRVYSHSYETDYGADTYSLGMHIGRSFELGAQTAIRPFASYEFMHMQVESHNEGPALYALSFSKSRHDLHRLSAGADISWTFDNDFWVSGRVWYAGLYGDRTGSAKAFFTMDPQERTFTSIGDSLDKHSLGLGAGVGMPVNERLDLTAGYSFVGGKESRTHMIEAGFRVKF